MALFRRQHDSLLDLSDEVLVHIMTFLSSSEDVMNTSLVCTKLKRIATDKKIMGRISFRKNFNMNNENIKKFLTIAAASGNTKVLNLNRLFWITPSIVHDQIVKMKNLEELHVVEINFTTNQFSTILSKLNNLKNLSFSWTWSKNTEDLLKPAETRGYKYD